jgi:adenosylcobinamide-GDP ribazoletransferase
MSDDGQPDTPHKDIGIMTKGSALKALISFFTIWHLDITQEDMDAMERGFHLVPIVGLLFGIIILFEVALISECSKNIGYGSSILAAIVALATVYIGSKFLHFDGLTDFGDGMIVSGDPEKHVRALKDTLVGAGGVGVALIVVLLSFATYSSVSLLFLIILAPLVEVLVKNAQVFAAGMGIAGPGMAGRQVLCTDGRSMVRSVFVSIIVGTVLCAIAAVVCNNIGGYWGTVDYFMFGMMCLLLGLVVSSITGWMMARVANRNFGMVNGDILGATNEISRVPVMFFMSILMAFMVVI